MTYVCPNSPNNYLLGEAYFKNVIIEVNGKPINTRWCHACAYLAKEKNNESWFSYGGTARHYDRDNPQKTGAKALGLGSDYEHPPIRQRDGRAEKAPKAAKRRPSGGKSGWQKLLDKNPDVATAKATLERAKVEGRAETYLVILRRLLKRREEEAKK